MIRLITGFFVISMLATLSTGCSREQASGSAATQPATVPVSTESLPWDGEGAPGGMPDVADAAPRDELIPPGAAAVDFTAKDQQGRELRLSELLKDQSVVLVFYPADFTPGCTRQLCAVRDEWAEFRKREAIVLGVNPADVEKHASFAQEYNFPFPVISDDGSRIAAAYGCKGQAYTKRAVYVIGRDGKVRFSEPGMVPHQRIFAALAE